MPRRRPDPLSRRERQIMDLVYALGSAGASDVRDRMVDPPSYSTVRTLMATLEDKGHLTHTVDGARYVYRPTVARSVAQKSALTRVVESFFGGSPEAAAVALLEMSEIDDATMKKLRDLVDQAGEEAR